MTENKRPTSMHNLDNSIRRAAGHSRAYVNVRSIISNAIVASMMPNGVGGVTKMGVAPCHLAVAKPLSVLSAPDRQR